MTLGDRHGMTHRISSEPRQLGHLMCSIVYNIMLSVPASCSVIMSCPQRSRLRLWCIPPRVLQSSVAHRCIWLPTCPPPTLMHTPARWAPARRGSWPGSRGFQQLFGGTFACNLGAGHMWESSGRGKAQSGPNHCLFGGVWVQVKNENGPILLE